MKISIIIPAYNEGKTIKNIINEIKKVDYNGNEIEIVIINDGSTDNTGKVLEGIRDKNIRVFNKINEGKGSAIIEGLKHALGEIVVIQDADMEYSPSQIPGLVKPIQDKRTKVVYGSRFLGNIENMQLPNVIANRLLTAMNNIFYNKNITDACTCYKILDAKLIKSFNLKDNGFDICQEITSNVFKRDINILEIPIHYTARSGKEGKKAKWWTLFKGMWAIIRYRFSSSTANNSNTKARTKGIK